MTCAFVFPGQGSQVVGMGKALSQAFRSAREVFEEVDDVLNQKLSALMFDGPEETLTLTENAQPAIMASSIAVLRVLEREAGMTVADNASYVAGHSLGEYSALCAAGVLSLADTARLLKLRGRAMQAAVAPGKGAMAAILGLDFETVAAIAKEASAIGVCAAANDNAPGQVVVSGELAAVERAIELAREAGAKRALMLAVSAPFHCSLMQPAADAMADALGKTAFSAPAVPVVTNVTAEAVHEPSRLRELLVTQITGMVRWRESVEWLAANGVTSTLEIGTGKVLSGLIKRISKDIEPRSAEVPHDLDFFLKVAA